MAVPHDVVIRAWADTGTWIKDIFPGLVKGTAFPDQRQSIGDFGGCTAQNSAWGGLGPQWSQVGNSTVWFEALKFTQFEGVAIQPASSIDAAAVRLPLGFSALQIEGTYRHASSCRRSDWGPKDGTRQFDGAGTLTERYPSGSLAFTASVGDHGVTLTGAVFSDAKPDVTLKPNDNYQYDWLTIAKPRENLHGEIGQVFTTANFVKSLIDILNKNLKS